MPDSECSRKSSGCGRGTYPVKCNVEPPTPVPELLRPKWTGASPALRRSSFQKSADCARSSVAKSRGGSQARPASRATTRKPARASLARIGAPPAPVPMTTASTTSVSANRAVSFRGERSIRRGSALLHGWQGPRLMGCELVEPDSLPAVRVRIPDVADLVLGERVAVVALDQLRQELLEEQRYRQCSPRLSHLATLHRTQHSVLSLRLEIHEGSAAHPVRQLIQSEKPEAVGLEIRRHGRIA